MIRTRWLVPLALATALVAGCGSDSACDSACGAGGAGGGSGAEVTCEASFSGNYTETALSEGSCAATSKASDGTFLLTLTVQSSGGAVKTTATFALGSSPSPGKFGPESVTDWSVVGVGSMPCAASAGTTCAMVCEFAAGNTSIPTGSFSLTLTRVDVSGSTPTLHGTLVATQTVQAGSGVDCGPGAAEEVAILF